MPGSRSRSSCSSTKSRTTRSAGKVLRLAGYIDDPLETADKARFDAVRAALEQGTLAAGIVDIEADLENETKVDLAPGTKPVQGLGHRAA